MGITKTAEVFKEKLLAAREAKGWSQKELAERLKVSVQTIYTWESGRKLCRSSRLERLAEVLDRSPDWFLQGSPGDSKSAAPKGFMGRMIAEARDTYNVPLKQLAQSVGRTPIVIDKWERGEIEPTTGEFEEAISAIESLGQRKPSRMLEIVKPVAALKAPENTQADAESLTVEIPLAWFERLVGFWDNMAQVIPMMEPVPSNIIELAKYRAKKDCLTFLNEASSMQLSRLFIEQAQGRLARALDQKTA